MKNRIDEKFAELRRKKKKAFIAFITAGDPSLAVTEKLVPALEAAGADIIELGVPFSDSLADGPTIQAASQRALSRGVTLAKILQTVKHIRRHTQIPIALMSSYNPVFTLGEANFVRKAKECGVDGVIIPDLPLVEAKSFVQLAKRTNLATVFFLSPTTTKDRMPAIVRASTGFIYFISLTGVTGVKSVLPADFAVNLRAAKKLTTKPICVGFGISTPQQVKLVGKFADGVIVGSAIVKHIETLHGRKDLVKQVQHFVQKLTR